MRGRILVSALAVCLAVVPFAGAGEGKSYGKGVTLTETTPVAKILADPDAYVGKPVRVEGKVKDVCTMAGCWMELVAGEGTDMIRVKVHDGVIVFPVTARGKTAIAEGVVEAIPMTKEKYVDYLEHIAHEQGKDFDPATVTGEGPFRIVQIQGTGARIPE